MPGQVGQHPRTFYLYFLILCVEHAYLQLLEYLDAQGVIQELVVGGVVEEDVGNATDGVEDEFLAVLGGPTLDGCQELGHEGVDLGLEVEEVPGSVLLVSAEICY